MNLYEITDGTAGCSYVRCYAWAEDADKALEMAQAKTDKKLTLDNVECLLSSDTPEPFCTEWDSEGWMVAKDNPETYTRNSGKTFTFKAEI